MKAFLLAAGHGTRLRPLTDHVPKCLVPIRGKPLLQIWLELCIQHGVDEVLINLHHLAGKVEAFLRGFTGPVRVQTAFEERLLGNAGTVLANRAFVAAEPMFLVLYADNLTNVDLTAMRDHHVAARSDFTIGLVKTDRPREKGIATLDGGGRVIDFCEKPVAPRSYLANAGIYIMGQKAFDFFPATLARSIPLDFGYHILPRLVGRMHGFKIEQYLEDIGTMERYESAQREWDFRTKSA